LRTKLFTMSAAVISTPVNTPTKEPHTQSASVQARQEQKNCSVSDAAKDYLKDAERRAFFRRLTTAGFPKPDFGTESPGDLCVRFVSPVGLSMKLSEVEIMYRPYFLALLLLLIYSESAFAQNTKSSGTVPHCTSKLPGLTKETLGPRHLLCGRMLLLETETGLSAAQAASLYSHSGAKNFGQFVVANIVSQRLNLDRDTVLNGLSSCSLGDIVQQSGIDPATSRATILIAVRELVQSEKRKE